MVESRLVPYVAVMCPSFREAKIRLLLCYTHQTPCVVDLQPDWVPVMIAFGRTCAIRNQQKSMNNGITLEKHISRDLAVSPRWQNNSVGPNAQSHLTFDRHYSVPLNTIVYSFAYMKTQSEYTDAKLLWHDQHFIKGRTHLTGFLSSSITCSTHLLRSSPTYLSVNASSTDRSIGYLYVSRTLRWSSRSWKEVNETETMN